MLTSEESPLSLVERYRCALACAFALKQSQLAEAFEYEGRNAGLGDADVQAAKVAATLMAMNNVYYRFLHLSQEPADRKSVV